MEEIKQYDISIIRPEVRHDDIRLKGSDMSPERLGNIKKGLRTLHTLELMAMTIYRFQITGKESELNRELVAAMLNEMTHYQDFQVKLYEFRMETLADTVGLLDCRFQTRIFFTDARKKSYP